MITLKHEKVKRVINVPTSVNEITPEVLENLSQNVILSKHHILVALCWKVGFGDIFFNKGKNSDKSAQVIPLAAKLSIPEDMQKDYEWLHVGQKIILTRSAIEMGVHVHIPNSASVNSISSWAEEASQAENPGSKGININVLPKGQFILIEFKVVNLSDITGSILDDTLEKDPFLINE